MHKIKCPIN